MKGQNWYCIGVLANMCNIGDYAILSNTETFVCNTEANLMQYQESSMLKLNNKLCIIKLLAYTHISEKY